MSDEDDDGNYNPQLARWQGKGRQKSAYRRAPKQEKETVRRLGARAIPASGSRYRKADAEIPNVVRIECKATEANSFRVTRDMMQKVEDAGLLEGQVPVIQIEFVDNVSNVLESFYVVPKLHMEHLIARLADAEGIDTSDKRGERRPEHHNSKLAKVKRPRRV